MKNESFESKKLAPIRIWQILFRNSDADHPLRQTEIARLLEKEYGIVLERKAIKRNLSYLMEAGIEIETEKNGVWLHSRDFDDSELIFLTDAVLSSKFIPAGFSGQIIGKLQNLSSRYFPSDAAADSFSPLWEKTESKKVFWHTQLLHDALKQGKKVSCSFFFFTADKEKKVSAPKTFSPYLTFLGGRNYDLFALDETEKKPVCLRIDRMEKVSLSSEPATPLRSLPGFENGIGDIPLSSLVPGEKISAPERILLLADPSLADEIIDRFGKNVLFSRPEKDPTRIGVSLQTSLSAAKELALTYPDRVEIVSPASLREEIREKLLSALAHYENDPTVA